MLRGYEFKTGLIWTLQEATEVEGAEVIEGDSTGRSRVKRSRAT